MNKNRFCVIMAGGVGSRFWPMSRTLRPKQFLDILGTGETLLQQTVRRFSQIVPFENILIVTSGIYKDLIKEQISGISDNQILCEPMRRNTAPCIAYANFKIQTLNPEASIVVAPSDHIILNEDEFKRDIISSLEAAEKSDCLLTLGIHPSRPDTGYGYIQFEDDKSSPQNHLIKKVKTFTEKPNLDLAKTFLASGDFLWNSGIFIWSLRSINKAFELYEPGIYELFREGMEYYNSIREEEFIERTYAACKSISIDYAVMEKAKNVYVLGADFGWSDLGTWGSLYEHRSKDDRGNAIVGQNVMSYESSNCIVNVPDEKVVVLQGLDGYIVVEQDNILLICRKEDEQQLRQVVIDVKNEKGESFI